MLCIFFHANHVQNNTQVVLKVFNQDATTKSQPIGVSLMGIPSNKHDFTLTLRMKNIIVFIFSDLTYYISCSTLISTIILRVQIYLFIYSSIYLLIRPIQPEGSLFGRFFNSGMLRAEGVS